MSGFKELLKPGQRIWVAGSSNEPTALLAALQDAALPDNLTFLQFPLAGYNNTDFTSLSATARQRTFFMSQVLKNAAAGRLDFIPMQMRAVFDYLAGNVDVALIQAAYDRNGQLRIGPNLDFVDAALSSASIVIAEVNSGFHAPLGCPLLEQER
ncbi:MAG: hypothetical protein ACC642_04875, partial [Pseudomonadales bacterium]